MNRITGCFELLRAAGKKGLIAYIMAGDPDLSSTVALTGQMAAAGADLIELGIPFSDPLADGPAIQQASQRSLAGGTTVARVLAAVQEIRRESDAPLILMTYYNPVFQFGLERFADCCAESGVDGLIVPDLPFEEAGALNEMLASRGVDLIPLVAPTTTDRRLAVISRTARGFVYCVSVTGVTGVREKIDTDLAGFTARVRRHTALPVAIGFGVSGPEQAAAVAAHCDAVVVGSAIVRIIAEKGAASSSGPPVASLVRELKAALSAV